MNTVNTGNIKQEESRLSPFRDQDERTEVVGLDIGTTKVVAIIGRKNQFGKVEILGYGKAVNRGVRSGVVVNLAETVKAINEAVQKAEYNAKIKIKKVIVGIAGQHIRSIQTSEYIMRDNPEEMISQEEIDRLIEQVKKIQVQPGEEIIHALPQEFRVDDEGNLPEIPIGMAGTRLEANFHVVVGKVAAIKNLVRCVKMAKLEVVEVTLEPLASAESVLVDEEKEGGIVLIDIGGGTTDIAIFKNNIIRHTAIIPYGGNIITKDLANGISVLERSAEAIKVKYGSAWPAENSETEVVAIKGLPGRPAVEISLKNISRIIKARVEEIIQMADFEIKKYKELSSDNKLLGGIVLTGGGSELKHLPQLVSLITTMYTRIGRPVQHLAGGTEEELQSPVYATAVGLLLKGLAHKKNYEYYEYMDDEELQTENETVQSHPDEKNNSMESNAHIENETEEQLKEDDTQAQKVTLQQRRKNGLYNALLKFLKNLE